MKKSLSLLNFLFFIFFLVVGFTTSTAIYHYNDGRLPRQVSLITSTDSTPVQTMINGQRNILLVNVDSFEKPNPELSGLWLITYLPPDATLNILPIYPSATASTALDASIQQSISLEKIKGKLVLGKDIITILKEANYWWSGYILLDKAALSYLTDTQNGRASNLAYGKQNQSIGSFSGQSDGSLNEFSAQLAVMQNICRNIDGLTTEAGLPQVSSSISAHVASDLVIDQIQAEWKALHSGEQHPSCRFPTLEFSRNIH